MASRRTRKWLAIAFALVALLLVAAATWLGCSARVLETPIRLTPGFRVQSAFRVWRKADYRISVYCSSLAQKEYLRKLLQGGNLVQITVSRNGDAVPLHLFPEPLFRPGIVSTDEWGNIVFGQNEAGQEIADLAGDFAQRYEITCSIVRPVAVLDQMHPVLRIEPDPLFFKGDLMLICLFYALAAVSAVIAIAAASDYFSSRGKT
jgi:hypothetical protein